MIDGRYRIVSLLGRGEMGAVWWRVRPPGGTIDWAAEKSPWSDSITIPPAP